MIIILYFLWKFHPAFLFLSDDWFSLVLCHKFFSVICNWWLEKVEGTYNNEEGQSVNDCKCFAHFECYQVRSWVPGLREKIFCKQDIQCLPQAWAPSSGDELMTTHHECSWFNRILCFPASLHTRWSIDFLCPRIQVNSEEVAFSLSDVISFSSFCWS